MTKAKDLARLGQITQLLLDTKLADLRALAAKRQHSLDLLGNLNRPAVQTDLPIVAAHLAEVRYQSWADIRRAEINVILARQTAEMYVARDAARCAFGRNQAFQALKDTLR